MLDSTEVDLMKLKQLYYNYQDFKTLIWLKQYFHYNKEDPFSYMCVVGTALPPTISVVLAVCYVYRRNKTVGKILLGLVANELINITLKYIIKDPRPSTAALPGHGFPSSHAQQMFFFVATLSRYATRRTAKEALFVLALFVAWSRYYLGFHNVKQVVGGSIIGACIGTAFTI